jgi:hypothetical protein
MSYSTLDAVLERTAQIEEAILSGDVEQLFAVADSFAEEDDMEQASYFRKLAQTIEDANWAYDRNNNN